MRRLTLVCMLAVAALTVVDAHAEDALKIAIGQHGNWENAAP